jgi:prenylcysteine oxidase/farnesylcysteine lyase
MPPATMRQRLATQPRRRLVLASVLFLLVAFGLTRPFSRPEPAPAFPHEDYTYPPPTHVHARPKRVAVVGAGASGAAAAWFVRRAGRVAERRAGVPEGTLLGEVVVFEQADYIGGRACPCMRVWEERS